MGNDFKNLANRLKELQAFTVDINLMAASVQYDAMNPSSIEVAMAAADQQFDVAAGRYARNPLVEKVAESAKSNIREQILMQAATVRLAKKGELVMKQKSDMIELLDEIEEAVLELQSADYQTIQRPMNTLVRLINSPMLDSIIKHLTEGIDLEAWLQSGRDSQGSMVGSAVLDWPDNSEAELGTSVLLINRLAEDSNFMQQFSFTFYHAGNQYTATLRKMVGSLIVPFNRRFARYVKAKLEISNSTTPVMTNITITNSQVGALQAGDSNVAHVGSVSNSMHAALFESLAKLGETLEKVDIIPGYDKEEILELIADSRKELAKDKPSKIKLSALLPVIGAATAVISDVGGAVAAVQAAAALLGLPF